MLEKVDNKHNDLAEVYQNFDLTDPCTEEEFDTTLNKVAKYLLFGTKWEPQSSVKKISVINDLPMICKGFACPLAAKCPVLKGMAKSSVPKIIGTDCRAEKIYGLEQFAAFIRELDISPEQTTDILNVTALVRCLIIKRRTDWHIAIEGLLNDEIAVVNQRTGQHYDKKVVHPLFKESEKLEKQIHALQSQLMASRKDRANLAATVGKNADILKKLFMGQVGNFKAMEAQDSFEDIIDVEAQP
jgi:hypothetical protein